MNLPPAPTADLARVASLTQLTDQEWDAALLATGLPFRFSHRAAAGRALEAAFPSYRFAPCRVDYDDCSSILFPLVRVIRRVSSLSMALGMPLSLEGTPLPLAGAVQPGHIRALFGVLQGCGTLELSGGAGGSPPAVGRVTASVTHALDLVEGFGAVWSHAFTAKNRNMCRKAERSGVSVALESTSEGAAGYHALYAASARSWGHTEAPYPGKLFTALVSSGHAELWLARLAGELVAGALLLRGSDDLLYWSGAMNREYRSVAPSNAVIRAAIEAACDRGVRYIDFGASAGLPGVEAFKRSFGAQPREYLVISLSSWRYRRLEQAQHLCRLRASGGS